jgi:hypothetical protein
MRPVLFHPLAMSSKILKIAITMVLKQTSDPRAIPIFAEGRVVSEPGSDDWYMCRYLPLDYLSVLGKMSPVVAMPE